jgi:hypothetical protein
MVFCRNSYRLTEYFDPPLILNIQGPRYVVRGGGRSYQNPRVPRMDWRLSFWATDEAQTTTIRFATYTRCRKTFRGRRFRGQRYFGITSVEHGSTILRVVHLKQGWGRSHQILLRTADPRIPLAYGSGWRWDISRFQRLRAISTPEHIFPITYGRYGGNDPRLSYEQGRDLLRYSSDNMWLHINLEAPDVDPWSYLATLLYVAWYSYFDRDALRSSD